MSLGRATFHALGGKAVAALSILWSRQLSFELGVPDFKTGGGLGELTYKSVAVLFASFSLMCNVILLGERTNKAKRSNKASWERRPESRHSSAEAIGT